jgi:uncharacterized protein YcnI
VSPAVVEEKTAHVFTLAVPAEKEGAFMTRVELSSPPGFSIHSVAPAPSWNRSVEQARSGKKRRIERVTWSGGRVPAGEDAFFRFVASPSSSKRYALEVRQSYSDGSVVDWSGPASSNTPAPVVESKPSTGDSAGSSTVAIVAGALVLIAAAGFLAIRQWLLRP